MNAAGLFAGPAPRIYSIDAGRPFLRDLAEAVLAESGDDPLALASYEIWLPTRRAARALVEAFLEVSGSRAIIAPRMRALGEDVDDFEGAALDGADELAPAASALERRLFLTRCVAAASRAYSGQENWFAALAGADALQRLLDSLYTEEIALEAAAALDMGDHAAHWRRALEFLNIVLRQWPAHLEQIGRIDPAARRMCVISRECDHLTRRPPAHPVLIAGTTGSAPATRRLMRAAANLPHGAVVLPGFDRALAADARAWGAVEDGHPQAGMKALIEAIGAAPSEVRAFPTCAPAPTPRARLMSIALRPAEVTDDWRRLLKAARTDENDLTRAVADLRLVETADEESEAGVVALLMREMLETPGKRAMLVTPDRGLAQRVRARLRRWNVEADDSAGSAFIQTPCGSYLRLIAESATHPEDAGALVAALRHPLTGLGLAPDERARAVDALDEGLRGPTLRGGPGAFRRRLADKRLLTTLAQSALGAIESAFAPWPRAPRAPFTDFLNAHLFAAERLAATDAQSGAERLWRGADGALGAARLAESFGVALMIGDIDAAAYPAAFNDLFFDCIVREPRPAHPRLMILGPLEARLQSADLVILGGLNEGVWPDEAGADPFLSREMRARLGLPSLQRKIGLSAHDFAQAACAPRVVLTRASRQSGAPARASRWIVRLKNILEAAGALAGVDDGGRLEGALAALDAAGPARAAPAPRPAPPVSSRPRRIGASQIEEWIRDPYAHYARHILRLVRFEAFNEDAESRVAGTLLHAAFERLARASHEEKAALFANRADWAKTLADEFGMAPARFAVWRTELIGSIERQFAFDDARLAIGAPVVIEGKGAILIDAPAGPFEITARADRIDLLHDGAAALFDYKLSPPTAKQIGAFDAQLPISAYIVEQGGFVALGSRRVGSYHYVRAVPHDGKDGLIGFEGEEAAKAIARSVDGFRKWVAAFDDPAQPYLSNPRPQFVGKRTDYDRLARRRERESEGVAE